VGTAFGICTAVQNVGLVIAPPIVGAIKDYTGEYYYVCFFFVCINLVGIVLNIWLYIEDIRNMDGVLNNIDRTDRISELI
jgi:nitrate/nitrite transporter NarK